MSRPYLEIATDTRWGTCEMVEGKPLQDFDQIDVSWGDGLYSLGQTVRVFRDTNYHTGHGEGPIHDDSAFLHTSVHGRMVLIRLRGSGLLVRRTEAGAPL